MYYEEQIVNGVLCWRSTPNGEWTRFTAQELTDKLHAPPPPLFRAAPDLLAALEDGQRAMAKVLREYKSIQPDALDGECWSECEAFIDSMNAAIAKAKGAA